MWIKCPAAMFRYCSKCHPGVGCKIVLEERQEMRAAEILNKAFRKWSDGGRTGLVDWTGDMGPGLAIDLSKVEWGK